MDSLLSGVRSTLTGVRPLLLAAGAAVATAGACYLMSRLGDKSRQASTQTQMEAPRWKRLYEKGPLLGTGGFGSVFAGTRKADGMQVALKFVTKTEDVEMTETPQGLLPLELVLMQKANSTPCSNILQLLEWFDEPAYYVMILERPDPCKDVEAFCEDHGGSLNEGMAKRVTSQLIRALLHCKSSGVFHRDVKADNLLIQTDSYKVKLFDFGCGDVFHSSVYEEYAGTIAYAPPELFLDEMYTAEPATVWSVGITLYRLVCGNEPFDSIEEIIDGNVRFPEKLSQECRHLISSCLEPDAADRPTLEQLELHHWFQ